MLDDQIIPLEFAGIRAGGESYGHRMLGRKVTLKGAKEYESALERVSVVARRESREQRIRKALDAATRAVSGAKWREDAKLLDTVVNLTEWPSVVMGNFDGEFLALPEEVLVTVMRDHQKYFAVEDREGKLAPHFLAVLNTEGDPQDIIRHGHERVLRARFNDARFFWNTDQKITLRCRVDLLKQVTFQKDLGSYYDKTLRVQRLASWMSETVKQAGIAVRPGIVHKAALLAKADLTSELVKEFTELQGVVGGLYAKAQGLDPAIGDAIYDHYKPESMDDAVPRTMEGAMLSIADKADSIAGMFALGLQPTGSKDPFALRRQANGIVRIIAEKKLPIGFHDLFYSARATYVGSAVEARFKKREEFFADLNIFFKERLTFYLREVGGFAYDVVNAVLEAGADDVVDAVARAQAVQQVREMADFQSIGMACKRIRNILRQSHEKGITPASQFEYDREEADEAKMLHAQLERMIPRVKADRGKKRYLDALHQLATLREPVDKFFDKVMVMVDDERVRANRLALLQTLLKEFSTIADFSEIVTEGKSSN
jgi:glycyl-tRNA synthetase beta chain